MTYGLAGPKQPGWSWDVDPRTSTSLSDRLHNITQSVPVYGKDPNMANARTTVGTGVGVWILGKIAHHFLPSIRRQLTFKVARHTKVAPF